MGPPTRILRWIKVGTAQASVTAKVYDENLVSIEYYMHLPVQSCVCQWTRSDFELESASSNGVYNGVL